MRDSHDFQAAVRGGRRTGRRTLVVHVRTPSAAGAESDAAATGVLGPPRVGFVVSKAVGSAVTRNRVRRRLRALMGGRVAALPQGALVVVRATASAATVGYDDLRVDLDSALRKL